MQKKFPRTILLSSVLCLMSFVSHAQWVSIPDTAFGTLLKMDYSSCMQGNNAIGWQMDTTCNAVVSATSVDCANIHINDLTGIQYFDNLRYLNCHGNQLTTMPTLPNLLTDLICSYNQLSNLPALPNSLTYLNCDNNQLSSLPTLPNSLTRLYCPSNQLSSLPTLPNSLVWLDCWDNQLSSLPALPNSLKKISCNNNQLSSLPTFLNSLTELNCGNNPLDSLPALPNSLTSLECYADQLSSLPTLPNSLTYLNCEQNHLTGLPVLPNSLTTLTCGYNQLTDLPSLPDSLTNLTCQYNRLNSLPELPDSLYQLVCSNNPYLFCLPQLKKIKNFNFSNTGITCLPDYPQSNSSSNPALNTFPLCDTSSLNLYGCGIYWNISGKVYLDSNANCLVDAGENTSSNLKVQLYQNGILQQQQNLLASSYSFDTDLGSYTYSIDTANLPFLVACPDSGYYSSVVTALDSLDADMNFGLHCKPGFDLIAQSITGGFVPGNIRKINIFAGDATSFYGAHCAAGTSGIVQLIINGVAHYISAASGALTPSSVVNDTITWSIADFGAVNFFNAFNVMLQTDTSAQLGVGLCLTLVVNPIVGDYNTANNILTECFKVVGSFDPNKKEVYPAGNIDTATHWLTYTIHFQNTGTAEAQHIYVTDTLDSNIDAASFQLLAYSHQPMVQLKGNNLRFNFPNINLPDSNTNEPLSHGYVQYKVKLKDNLPVGTNINNTAFIYFDFNAPVVTNTTTNTIALATGVANLGLRNADFGLNPNPANESVRLSMEESMLGSNLTITDITGREVLHSAVQIHNPKFDIRNLSPGVYFVTLENKTGSVTKKFLKQ